jgi:hypothetical protein
LSAGDAKLWLLLTAQLALCDTMSSCHSSNMLCITIHQTPQTPMNDDQYCQ